MFQSTNNLPLAIPDDELACFHTIKYILSSHKNLNENDIHYASNYICSFYSHDRDNMDGFDDNKLVMFLVYIDRRGICKFAFIFNENIDCAIRTRNNELIKLLVLTPKEKFIELYDNPFLPEEDREFIIRLVEREMFAMRLILGTSGNNVCTGDACNRCYDEVCLEDAKILSDDSIRGIMSKYEKPPETCYTIDNPTSTPQVFCFDVLELIGLVCTDQPMNPKSQLPFSSYSLSLIKQRFHKEIALYRRYLQIRDSKRICQF